MGTENEESHINLTKAVNSLKAVALADYALNKDNDAKEKYSDFVTEKVIQFLIENAELNRENWETSGDGHELAAGKLALCPPGFHEENGLCIPN